MSEKKKRTCNSANRERAGWAGVTQGLPPQGSVARIRVARERAPRNEVGEVQRSEFMGGFLSLGKEKWFHLFQEKWEAIERNDIIGFAFSKACT